MLLSAAVEWKLLGKIFSRICCHKSLKFTSPNFQNPPEDFSRFPKHFVCDCCSNNLHHLSSAFKQSTSFIFASRWHSSSREGQRTFKAPIRVGFIRYCQPFHRVCCIIEFPEWHLNGFIARVSFFDKLWLVVIAIHQHPPSINLVYHRRFGCAISILQVK